jgi:hypothetical protein
MLASPFSMKRRSRLLLLLCLLFMGDILAHESAAASASPDEVIGSGDLKYIAIFTGQCRFQMPKGSFPCNPKVVLISLRNGRSLLAFSSGEIVFNLSGGQDRQPNLENYYLSIDSLGMDSPDINAVDRGLEGECHFHLSRDATKFFSIKCDVYNRAQGERFSFALDKISNTHRRSF